MEDDKLSKADFGKYLKFFLEDNPNADCPKGGHAAYSSAVKVNTNSSGYSMPGATYFVTYHKILKGSAEYTNALSEARKIADNITKALNEGRVVRHSTK